METLITYIWFLINLKNLPKHCGKTLIELIKTQNQSGEILVNKYIKEKIAKELEVGLDFVNKDINLLYKSELIIRIAKGCYKLNPKHFTSDLDCEHLTRITITIYNNNIDSAFEHELLAC